MPKANYQAAYALTFAGDAAATANVQRVTSGIVDVATDVAVEAGSTTNHVNRVLLAKEVLRNPEGWGKLFALSIAVDTTFAAATATDSEIKTAILAAWDAFAGAV